MRKVIFTPKRRPNGFYNEPGPYAAIQTFRQNHPDFVPDRSYENLLYTQHPCGWLRRMESVN